VEGRGLSDGQGLDIILLVVKLKRKAPKIGGLFILSGSPVSPSVLNGRRT
jgi:hypothetical protein